MRPLCIRASGGDPITASCSLGYRSDQVGSFSLVSIGTQQPADGNWLVIQFSISSFLQCKCGTQCVQRVAHFQATLGGNLFFFISITSTLLKLFLFSLASVPMFPIPI